MQKRKNILPGNYEGGKLRRVLLIRKPCSLKKEFDITGAIDYDDKKQAMTGISIQ